MGTKNNFRKLLTISFPTAITKLIKNTCGDTYRPSVVCYIKIYIKVLFAQVPTNEEAVLR